MGTTMMDRLIVILGRRKTRPFVDVTKSSQNVCEDKRNISGLNNVNNALYRNLTPQFCYMSNRFSFFQSLLQFDDEIQLKKTHTIHAFPT